MVVNQPEHLGELVGGSGIVVAERRGGNNDEAIRGHDKEELAAGPQRAMYSDSLC